MTLPTPDTDGLVGAGAPYPVSLGGREYLIDLSQGNFVERTIPLLRNQADTATEQVQSEASLNPEDLVRRSVETCHLGAGQNYRDRIGSVPERFRTSDGVDVWTQWQLSLLPETKSIRTLTTDVFDGVLSVGSYLYVADGNNLYFSNSALTGAVSWTTVTGAPGGAISSICTDGNVVYASFGASGIYRTTAGAASMASILTGTTGKVMFLKDRLFCFNGGGVLYNPTDLVAPAAALPTALYDKGSNWAWLTGCAGNNHVYFAGSYASSDHSIIFKTAVKPDGTAMDTPTVAATLPDGERLVGMTGYLGFIVLGVEVATTVVGAIRLAQIQSDGNLVLGPRIPTSFVYVWAFEPQDRFVYCTWTEYSTQSGIGRIDLSRFTEPLTPAYAKDIQYDGASLGYVTGITTHQAKQVFRIADDFLACTDSANLKPYGDIYFGKVGYGLLDSKVAMYVDVDMVSPGTVTVYVSVDGGARTQYGVALSASGTIDLSALSGKEFEVSLRLTRSSGAPSTGPTVRRVTIRSFINAARTREFLIPVIVRPRIKTMLGQDVEITDTRAEIDAINAMVGTVVVWKYGTKTEYVQVRDYQWVPEYFDTESGQFGGICMVKAQAVHT